MTMISPFSGALEQQDLIPLRRNQEFYGLGKIRALLFGRDEGVAKKPQARRCPRPVWAGPTRPGTWAAWATPIWPSWLSSLRSSSLCLSPDEKLTQYFSFYYLRSCSS